MRLLLRFLQGNTISPAIDSQTFRNLAKITKCTSFGSRSAALGLFALGFSCKNLALNRQILRLPSIKLALGSFFSFSKNTRTLHILNMALSITVSAHFIPFRNFTHLSKRKQRKNITT